MKIDVLFFGVLKEIVERPTEAVELPDGARVKELLTRYVRRFPRLDAMIPSLAVAVNQEYCGMDRTLRDGDEVGLLPPVSGGFAASGEAPNQGLGEIRVVWERIDSEAVVARLKRPEDGAAVVFDGVVRDNTRRRRTLYLEYEAYEPMALKQLQSLAEEARTRFAVRGISIIHRLGRLEIGDTSVLIGVGSAHRAAAFEACGWIIDTLKKTVPIWKKEYFEDGAVWAEGEAFPEEIKRSWGTAAEPTASK